MKKWVFLFPGQGSQFVGMGQSILETFHQAREVFQEASDTLSYNMQKLCLEDPKDQLKLTEYTQPALLTTSIAFLRLLNKLIPTKQVSAMAGHSVGEYVAHVASGVLKFPQSLQAVRQRGYWMQNAVAKNKGGMVAGVGLSKQNASPLLYWLLDLLPQNTILEPAAYNAPLQTVLSGHKQAIDLLLKTPLPQTLHFEKQPKFVPLKVSAPFHCSLMQPAQEKMTDVIDSMDFQKPQSLIVPNTLAHGTLDVAILKNALKEQITQPVQWLQTIQYLKDSGYKYFVEVGPGKVLSGLLKQIDRDLISFSITEPKDFDKIASAN